MKNRTLWIILTVLWVLMAVPSALFAVTGVMIFDSPGAEENPLTWWLFWCAVVLPFAWLLGAGTPWIFYKRRWAGWLFLVPFVDVAIVIFVWAWLDRFCGGGFACK